MSYNVVITDAAKQDLIDIIDYLHEISESYSIIFISEFEEYLAHLEEAPELFIRVRGKFRRMYLKRFKYHICLLYTSPSPRDRTRSRMPSSA